MRFRIAHQSGKVTLSIPALPAAQITFDLSTLPGLFDPTHAFLFLSNSSEGTTFRHASVRAH